jgi:hypothetical protein
MRVQKDKVKLMKNSQKAHDNYIDATPAERVSFIWELTKEIWCLSHPKEDVERRLQRNITKLIKK